MADDLRRRTPEELVALLTARPDLARPEPADVTALAARAGTQGSVHRALDRLDTGLLLVLESACRAGDPVDESVVAALLGVPLAAPSSQLEELWRRGLLWRDDRGLHPTREVLDILGGRPPESASIPGRPDPTARPDQVDPAPAPLRPPEVPVTWLPPDQVADLSGLQASLVLELVDQLAAAWGQAPPRVLRQRGLAVRDLSRVEETLGIDTGSAAALVETCREAGLIEDDGGLDPVWAPTVRYDDWRELPAEDRWVRLARAWLDMPRAPHLLGTRPSAGMPVGHRAEPTTVNALSQGTSWPAMRGLRRLVLEQLAVFEPGADPDALAFTSRMRWLLPRADADLVDSVTAAVLGEAHLLGLAVSGALAPAGRALLAGSDEDARSLLTRVLPAAATSMVLQADLTAVVPGRLEGELADVLRGAADVESRGGASVHRFGPDSVRRWFDSGRSADDLIARLSATSLTPLPQPLRYLIDDVSRRHGQVVVGAMSSYLTCEDESVIDAVMSRRELSGLGLRRLSPTVLVSPRPPTVLVARLREADLAPLVETADGRRVGTTAPRRAQVATQSRAPATRSVEDERADLVRVVDRLLAAPARDASPGTNDHRPTSPRVPPAEPAVALALVREALVDHRPVWLGVVDATGTEERLLFHPSRIEAGRLLGTSEGSPQPRSIALHRITGVLSVDGD